jgi:hypothetical protein
MHLFFIIGVITTILSQFTVSVVVIVIRKLKGVHFAIVNGAYGVFLTIVSVITFIIYRYALGYNHDYNFTSE